MIFFRRVLFLLLGQMLLKDSGCGGRSSVFSKVLVILSDGIPNQSPKGAKPGLGFKSLYDKAEEIRISGKKLLNSLRNQN